MKNNFKKIFSYSFVLILATLTCFMPLYSCDLDGDGIADPLSYTESGTSWNWSAFLSTGGTFTKQAFGQISAAAIPGKYFNANDINLAFVDTINFWTFLDPNGNVDNHLNFGAPEATFAGNKDLNGDNIADGYKFFGRCERKLRKSCLRSSLTGNFFGNVSDGISSFMPGGTTKSGTYGNATSAITILDVNGDGKDDVCTTKKRRAKPQTFTEICRDVLSGGILKKKRIGRFFKEPLKINIAGQDQFLIWRFRKGKLNVRIIDPNSRAVIKKTFVTVPDSINKRPLIADYLGLGYEQIAVANSGILSVHDPLTGSSSTLSIPTGTAVDCSNDLFSRVNVKLATTKNICKIVDCK